MQILVDEKLKRKQSFQHNNTQAGWKDSSAGVGYANGQLADEDFHQTLVYHRPLWRYIINHYFNEHTTPITVIGYDAIALAIELSQWGYPITYIAQDFKGVKKAQKDCEIQAGEFRSFLYFDATANIPANRLMVCVDLLDTLDDHYLYTYLDLCLRRSREILCCVDTHKDWSRLLSGKYTYTLSEYPQGDRYLLSIKAL